MLGAYAPYARYFGGGFIQRLESSRTPSPCIADEQSSEAKKVKPVKGEKIDRKDILKNKNIHQKKDEDAVWWLDYVEKNEESN